MDYITATVTQFYFWTQDREGPNLIALRGIRRSCNTPDHVKPIIANSCNYLQIYSDI